MTDRVMVYDGALPQTTDILNASKFAMQGDAYAARAILGLGTVVAGLACGPTVPASLQVTVGPGSIYQLDPTDASAYADLGVDNTSIVKQGILDTAVNLTITPPGTVGFSQVYLVQAILQNLDSGQMVLSYYNSANPAAPYAGPSNSGSSNFTVRESNCAVALKAGVPATTGTQATPAPDSGYVGLYAITVANGASTVTGGNIVQLPTAPFFPTLPAVPAGVQQGLWTYVGTDTGAANAYVIAFGANQPIPAAYVAGMAIRFKALNANTTTSTINVNGLGNVTIKRAGGSNLSSADISSGQIVELVYDGTNFQMMNYLGVSAGSTTNNFTSVGIPYIADSGAVNALIGTYAPAITGGQQVAGLTLAIKLANTITGACTINVSGLGLKNVFTGDLQNPPNGVFVAGEILLLEYDGTQYQIVNTSSLTFRKPSANTTIYVNGSTGSDTLRDGTASTVGTGTSGPFATIQKAVNTAFGYAPSQFSITISIAAGTYNESVKTPSYAGPNIIVDNGLSPANVLVNSNGLGNSFQVSGPNTMTVRNLTVQATGGAFNGFAALNGSTMFTQNTISNGCGSAPFAAASAGTMAPGTHTFSGSSAALFGANSGGSIQYPDGTVYTISTAINVSIGSAYALANGIHNCPFNSPISFVNGGFVSGPRYLADYNGVVFQPNTTTFPGSVGGTKQRGGQDGT